MTDQNKEALQGFENELVEGSYYTVPELVLARLLALDKFDGHWRGIISAVLDWVKHKFEVERLGKQMACLCCREFLKNETPIAGFIIMVRTADGGLQASKADCIVGAVCGDCHDNADGDIDRIIEKAMPNAKVQHLHPASDKLQ